MVPYGFDVFLDIVASHYDIPLNNFDIKEYNYYQQNHKRTYIFFKYKLQDIINATRNNQTIYLDPVPVHCSELLWLNQVINHGISDDLMHETMTLYEEFFSLPVDEHESLLSDDFHKSVRLYTSGYSYANEEFHLWKDSLKHPACAHPLDEVVQGWPDKPERYRDIITKYSVEVTRLNHRILNLICEGLGLEEGFFRGKLSEVMGLVINNYPPCPEPSLTLGLRPHCDPYTLTLVQQQVYGLQIKKRGQWIGVDPIPNAFLVIIPYQLQVISNGRLSSCEHRGVTNSSTARISIVTFCGPNNESVIEPAKDLVSASNPPRFKTYQCSDFLMNCLAHLSKLTLSNETAPGPYML